MEEQQAEVKEAIQNFDAKEATEEEEDTPFYLRQDRPVFSGKERAVPTSSAARAFEFGKLGVSILGGTLSEALLQGIGVRERTQSTKSGLRKYALNERNAERISLTLCKMRGAALKIGQILSNMEDSVIPPAIKQSLERARKEADIMPKEQVTKMLEQELGSDWQKEFRELNLYPIAAASIGQVHEGITKDGQKVAVKIQYPGVQKSIDSDMANFQRLI